VNILKRALLGSLRIAFFGALKAALCVYILRLAHEFQSFYLAFGELDRADARRVVGKIEAKAPDLGRIDAPENPRRVAGDHRDATPFVLAILAADH
jgi:hypothetical protein